MRCGIHGQLRTGNDGIPVVKRPKHDTRHKGPHGYAAGPPGNNRKPLGVVVHSTESDQRIGPTDRHGVIDFLADTRGLSVPVVIDDESMTEMVPRPYCGFHALGIHYAHGIEQIGRANWSRAQWLMHRNTIERTGKECAWFLAEVMGLPVTDRTLKRFVIGHVNDDRFGGTSTHYDPGPNYPWDVLRGAAMDHARVVGYRVVATKGDRKLERHFKVTATKRASAWAIKKAKRGWRVVLGKKRFHADLD